MVCAACANMCHCCSRRAIVLILVLNSTLRAAAFETPEYILPCNRTDPDINSCIKRGFTHLRPYIADGIPELSVPPMEPLVIPLLMMENGNGAVRVRAAFNNMTIRGASNYSITWIKSDVSKYRIEMGLALPRIEATGRYEVTGNILLFPVRSKGEFRAVFYNISAVSKILGKEVTMEDGKQYMRTDNLFVDFNLGKSRFRIKDYLNDGNILGEAMNQFLNQNADEIIKEMKPAASQTIARYFRDFLNAAFLKIPIEVWLRSA
ncbi:Protein takeout [Zootermopsis nevadensis]|uniref:Protein takeout n=1 Tax=Zootermopsis nevadensis TaxID=136037 RepID=A0A067R731_ZOONE|nr:Protein takeout [Zootermopsis nevadensis]